MGLAQAHPNKHWSLHTQQDYLESTTSCEKMKIIIHLFLQKQMGWRMLASYDMQAILHMQAQLLNKSERFMDWSAGLLE